MGKIIKALRRFFCCGGWKRNVDDERVALVEETTDEPLSTGADNTAMTTDEATVDAVETTVQQQQQNEMDVALLGLQRTVDTAERAALESDLTITLVIGERVENVNDLNRLFIALNAKRERFLCELKELGAKCRALDYLSNSNRIRRDNGSDHPLPTAAATQPRHHSVPPPNQLGLNVRDTISLVEDDDDDDEDEDDDDVYGSLVSSVVMPVVEYDYPPPSSVLLDDGSAARRTSEVYWATHHPWENFYF